MSPPGRPKGEYRRAQPEGPRTTRLRWALIAAGGLGLAAVFAAYLRPDFVFALAAQVWSCF
jgi:hypothetical protein